nr:transposase [Streptomyces humi]
MLYQNRTGCQWEFLPHAMPAPRAVKYYFEAGEQASSVSRRMPRLTRRFSLRRLLAARR